MMYDTIDSVAAHKAACGYVVNETTCASCAHCRRQVERGHVNARCGLHDFVVNLDRGSCRSFKKVRKIKLPNNRITELWEITE